MEWLQTKPCEGNVLCEKPVQIPTRKTHYTKPCREDLQMISMLTSFFQQHVHRPTRLSKVRLTRVSASDWGWWFLLILFYNSPGKFCSIPSEKNLISTTNNWQTCSAPWADCSPPSCRTAARWPPFGFENSLYYWQLFQSALFHNWPLALTHNKKFGWAADPYERFAGLPAAAVWGGTCSQRQKCGLLEGDLMTWRGIKYFNNGFRSFVMRPDQWQFNTINTLKYLAKCLPSNILDSSSS